MSKNIEPPVLISRVLALVLSASIVVLGALVFTLIKMAPLNRPEVFFLRTPTRSSNLVIFPLTPDQSNSRAFELYIYGFIREYIIARNTLLSGTNVAITRDNWSNIVKPWSSEKVFSEFQKTSLYKRYTFNDMLPPTSCSVNFESVNNERPIAYMNNGRYEVNFIWICKNENSGGQPQQKNYKIQLRIQSALDGKVSSTLNDLEKLRQNPLGIQVVEYQVTNNRKDPLNSDSESW